MESSTAELPELEEGQSFVTEEVLDAMENKERRDALGDKFAGMTVEQRLDAVEGSLKVVGKDMSVYKRDKIKKWCKKMRRQLKNAKA